MRRIANFQESQSFILSMSIIWIFKILTRFSSTIPDTLMWEQQLSLLSLQLL